MSKETALVEAIALWCIVTAEEETDNCSYIV